MGFMFLLVSALLGYVSGIWVNYSSYFQNYYIASQCFSLFLSFCQMIEWNLQFLKPVYENEAYLRSLVSFMHYW